MKNLQYKDYIGSIEYSEEDNLLYGKVQQIKGLISYEGIDILELKANFIESIDEYFEECELNEVEPEKPFKGVFQVRTSSSLHRKLFEISQEEETSLNEVVNKCFEVALASK